MTPVEQLTAARAWLAEDPSRLIKGTSCRTASGVPSWRQDMSDAVSACLVGSLWKIESGRLGVCDKAEGFLNKAVRSSTAFSTAVQFNDYPTTTHADVLRVYDLAIARARETTP